MGNESTDVKNVSPEKGKLNEPAGKKPGGIALRVSGTGGDIISGLLLNGHAEQSKGAHSAADQFFAGLHSKKLVILVTDLLILTGSFLVMALYKPATVNYLSNEYLNAFGCLLLIWMVTSFYFKKYDFKKKVRTERFVRIVLLSNFFALGAILVLITLLWYSGFSRIMLFGTVGLATILELITGNVYYSLLRTTSMNGYDPLNPPANTTELRKAMNAKNYPETTLESDIIKKAVSEECGEGIYSFLKRYLDADCTRTLFISTSSRINIEMHPGNSFQAIVNMKRVNDINFINKFFETANRKLPAGGTFIGCAETKDQRKVRIMKKYPPVVNRAFYALDYLLKRVFPKFILTKKLYYFLTRGQNRVFSRAELLGRLYSCGFELIDDTEVSGMYCFVVRKVKSPVYDLNPTYGPFIKLRRVGRNGRIIRVYKFRTMHPYAEYLQDYLLEKNSLEKGGKYRNDFRVTTLGRFMRALWIDELPMLFNLLKGDVKLVGVRPLSMNYFCLYDKSLQEKRIKFKPGLIPPFYADMPETLDEIQASEMRYLQSYESKPLLTDLNYLGKAFLNITLKKARSR
jgi:lipopolysaccharide/colanic/teichoic acid biosynthesis glycosyltransferase